MSIIDSTMTADSATGFAVNQYLFNVGVSKTALAKHLGISRPAVSQKVHGRVSWSLEEIYGTAELLSIDPIDLLPRRDDNGNWLPAPFIPGKAKAPEPSGSEASHLVAGAGFEPTTSGL